MPSGFWFISFILPSACSLSAYSFETIVGEGHRDVGEERSFLALQRELHGQVVDLLDRLSSRSGMPMPAKYSQEAPSTYLFQGLSAFHWRSNEKITSSALRSRVGREEFGGVELHAGAQLEACTAGRHRKLRPAFGERGDSARSFPA